MNKHFWQPSQKPAAWPAQARSRIVSRNARIIGRRGFSTLPAVFQF